ncbi:unnamed protein product [Hymenolepis diminuta]|uniref:Signal peptidase complex subunit 1 n=1 Tax=Hymenolepis diminuta TaxID=6216 RepID=A0A564YGI7_HYMDI|nr:unnamed protein product [Hymenolepis diminuta]
MFGSVKQKLSDLYEEYSMDLEGQKLAERIMNVVLPLFCFIGFIAGYLMEQLSISVGLTCLGLLICAIIVLPSWPMYRKHPLKWQKCEKRHSE